MFELGIIIIAKVRNNLESAAILKSGKMFYELGAQITVSLFFLIFFEN